MYKYFVILYSFHLLSCSSSQNVSNGSFVQKRKYTRGYYFDFLDKKEFDKNTSLNQSKIVKLENELIKSKISFFSDSLQNVHHKENLASIAINLPQKTETLEGVKQKINKSQNIIQDIQNQEPEPDTPIKPKYDKTAKRAYLFGILSIFILRIFFGILAIYYGIKTINKINSGQLEEFNRKKAVTGILLGFFMLIISFLYYYIILKLFDLI